MSQETQAEMFIRALTEVWEEDRTLGRVRLRHEIREQVRRFVQEFRTELEGQQPRTKQASSRTRRTRTPPGQVHGQ
ncbi:hypothetical protein [Rhodobaculum claviforme]|uniref:Uncharacterized protein n=1 Tax=Rhodobaculum claviforme TaxID=1549854 RepID=A0A934TKT3_9RHOB|nr:hypothetical protein [Rhodobaculum claviforme]MBK5927443.1 hypothetical protein [Rhodobaculum claviforme]